MIHQPLSPDGVHPQINSSLRLLGLCLVRPDLLLFGDFLKKLISFIGSLNKCHTSVFNTLIFCSLLFHDQELYEVTNAQLLKLLHFQWIQ